MAACAARRSSGPVLRSASPSGSFNRHFSAPTPQPHPFASTTSSAFISSPRSLRRPTSPTRVNIHKYTSASLSFFSMDRSGSPSRSISRSTSVSKPPPCAAEAPKKRTCMCAPTNHPGSFRCSLHKAGLSANNRVSTSNPERTSFGNPGSSLDLRRTAMRNSLLRIGTVEGYSLKRALAALVRPSSHHQRRPGEFRRRPSRLSAMSKA